MRRHTIPASGIIGTKVLNIEGQTLGHIVELMIDAQTGHVAYAALSSGGFMGVGDKLFVLPWSVLRPDTLDDAVYVDMDKQALRSAPGIDKDDWPDVDVRHLDEVFAHYKVYPYWQPHQ